MRIEVSDLRFSYGGRVVFHGLSHRFDEGVVTGLIGPNGSGKTTLIKLISGSMRPDAGAVLLERTPSAGMSDRRRARLLSLVPQQSRLDFDFTVMDVVLMGRQPYLGRFEQESLDDIAIAREAMETLGLSGFEQRNARFLSGGEWQRVLVARALCQQTPAMLMDEPVSSLDIHHQMEVLSVIRSLARKSRTTVVMVLHDLNLAAHYCDNLVLMQHGRIEHSGSVADVLTSGRIRQVYGIDAEIECDKAGQVLVKPVYL